MKKIKLADLVTISAGHPFRGTITTIPNAKTHVVQVRDINAFGEISIKQLITTELTGRKKPDWLKTGDILFIAKGAKHFAVCVDQVPEYTVCSPHFFIARIKPKFSKTICPKFISWQLNQLSAQRYFQITAEGSLYVSIRRQVLEDTPIKLPSFNIQEQLVALHNLGVKEHKVLQQLIENRRQQLNTIALDILNNQDLNQ